MHKNTAHCAFYSGRNCFLSIFHRCVCFDFSVLAADLFRTQIITAFSVSNSKRNIPKDIDIDTEDFSCVMLRFDGGAVGTASFSAVFPGKKNQTVLQLAGTKASLEWDSARINDLSIGHWEKPNELLTKDPSLVDKETASIIGYPGGHAEGFPDAFKQNFTASYSAIRGDAHDAPFATFADGLHVMKVCDALYESAHSGKWIHINRKEHRMKLGVVANVLQDKLLSEALQAFQALGIIQIEPACGGYAGKAHMDPAFLLTHPAALEQLHTLLQEHGISISALSCHGNPVHPDSAISQTHLRDMQDTVRLAKKLGADTITCFSGCPGDCETSRYPNWVTCAWPNDNQKILKYQWNTVLIPFWKEFVAFAKEFG